ADVVDARARAQAVGLHGALARDEQRGGPVRDLARYGRREPPARRERRELRHLLEARVAARPLVAAHVAERHDLVVEAPLVDGADRALVALEREALHVLARDAPLLGDHLGAAELRHLARSVARHPAL